MADLEHRTVILETIVTHHESQLVELRADMRTLRDEMSRRFEHVDQRFGHVDQQLLTIRAEMSSHFMWVIGIQMAAALTVIGALVNLR
ncbi:MAG: hypothetical protein AB7P99_21075 [Vicinamibacterales bacterium]